MSANKAETIAAIATAVACSSYSLTTRTFDPSMMLLIITIFIAGFVLEVRGAIISVLVSLGAIVAVISWNHESELWTAHQTYWSLGTVIMCILSALVSMASARVNRRFFLAEQRSQPELAEAFGCTVKDIKNRVHRGRKKLAAYLREEVARYALSPGEHAEELRLLGRFFEYYQPPGIHLRWDTNLND